MAKVATQGNINELNAHKSSEEKRKAQELEEARQLAKELEAVIVTIPSKAGEGGKLFGAITSKQIAERLKQMKVQVDKRKIMLAEPIRSLGYTNVPVKIHHEVMATIKVHVVDEK